MRRVHVVVAAAFAIVGASGCATVADDLQAGKPFAACVRAHDHDDEAPALQTWIAQNAKIEMSLVPRAEIERIAGGPIAGYGDAIGVYDVDARIPGGVLAFELANTSTPSALVARLPALVKVAHAPQVADGVVLATLDPEPRGTTHEARGGGGSVVGDIFDAFIGIGTGLGVAVGAAVAVPVGIMVGVAKGIGSFLDFLGGRSSSSSSSSSAPPPPIEDVVAPLSNVDAPAVARVDALLSPAEREAAQKELDAEFARYDDALAKERARRVSLANDLHAFGLDESCANHAHCRVVIVGEVPAKATIPDATFRAPDGDACTELAAGPIDVHVKKAALASTNTAPSDLDRMRTELLAMTTSLDDGAPSYALLHPTTRAASTKHAARGGAEPASDSAPNLSGARSESERSAASSAAPNPSASEASEAAATSVLRCEVKTKAYAKDSDGSAPDLAVRVTAGSARVRVHEAFLGVNAATAKFAVPGLALQRGDRVRLSFVSKQDQRSLGGAIETFDGSPLVFENAALRASCVEGAVDVDAVNGLQVDAEHAVDAYAASGGDRRSAREKAEAAIVSFAGERGWRDDAVRTLVKKLDEAAKAVAPSQAHAP